MNYLSNSAQEAIQYLSTSFPYINSIENNQDYEAALEMLEILFEDYETNKFLVDLLSLRVKEWEDSADEFQEFNSKLASSNQGLALLAVLIDQYQLKLTDFKNEIGSKSLVSQILNGKRSLTKQHIENLAERFHLSPAAFF